MWTACIPRGAEQSQAVAQPSKREKNKLLCWIKIYLNYSCAQIWNSACMFVDMQICASAKTFKAGRACRLGWTWRAEMLRKLDLLEGVSLATSGFTQKSSFLQETLLSAPLPLPSTGAGNDRVISEGKFAWVSRGRLAWLLRSYLCSCLLMSFSSPGCAAPAARKHAPLSVRIISVTEPTASYNCHKGLPHFCCFSSSRLRYVTPLAVLTKI